MCSEGEINKNTTPNKSEGEINENVNKTTDPSKSTKLLEDSSSSSSSEGGPMIMKAWSYLYNAVPKVVFLYGTNTSMTLSLLFAVFFRILHLFVWKILLISILGFPSSDTNTRQSSVYIISIIHSLIITPSTFTALITQTPIPSQHISKSPKWWIDATHAIMEFTTGYFIYDGFFNSILPYYGTPGGIPTSHKCFLGHHVGAGLCMVMARVTKSTHMSALTIMFFGEASNPAQNSRSLIKILLEMGDCCSSPKMVGFYPYLDFTYGLLYSLIRIGVNPGLCVYTTYDYLFTKQGRQNISKPVAAVWLFCFWGISIGSIPWCLEAAKIVEDFIVDGPVEKEL